MPKHIQKMSASLLLLILFSSIPITVDAAGNDDHPNIVLVLMDNFGYGEPGVYGGGAIRGAPTPNIDSIAHEGLQLTNYNVDAECTPSRTSLMSGRYSMRTRLRQDGPTRGAWYGLTQWEYTLAEFLSDAGYATGMFGKWHLGDTEGRFPTDQGFDEWWGIPRSSDRSFWPDSSSYQDDAGARFIYIMSAMRGEEPKELEVYGREKRATFDREVTDRAVEYIERKAEEDRPFFLYLPLTQTHTPHDAHPDARGQTGNGDFADILAQTDTYVGELLTAVDDAGIRDDTIFIFTSDNGGYGGIGREGSNGPWRGSIFTSFEGGIRVPFLIRWPGQIPARRVSNEIVHAMDVYATLAGLLGLDMPTDRIMDSADHSDFLLGKSETSARESFVIYVGNEIYGAKWRNWKMLYKEIERIGEPVITNTPPTYYNLYKDPGEQERLRHYIQDTWIATPFSRVLAEHRASLESDPGAPDP